jgi:predicted nucleic acid-binding protein
MILLDCTVLSNFAVVHRPESIVQAFFEKTAATEAVFDELEAGMRLGRIPECDWNWLKKIPLTLYEQQQFQQLNSRLGRGEASCLAAASQRKWKIATDDKDARRWAVRLHVPCTGTLGILTMLVKRRHISLAEGNEWLCWMMQAGYHSPVTELDELVHGSE